MPARIRECIDRQVGIWIILGALLVGGGYYYQVNQQQRRSECQSKYNVAVAAVLGVRSQLTAASDNNQTNLILGVARLTAASTPGETPTKAEQTAAEKQYRKLFTDFTVESNRIESERKANPVPELPSCALS